MRSLLALGAGHLLAGIVFFFAFNWDALPLLAKFSVLQGGVIVAVGGALVARIDRPAGRVLLISANVLAGTLLAVIGQVYQTGADAWQLFSTWALLTLPWAIASRSAVHWLVWLIVFFLAANLYGFQVLVVNEVLTLEQFDCLAAIAIVLVLIVREALVVTGADWLGARWTRVLPAVVAPLIVFMEAIAWVFGQDENIVAAATFIALLVSLAAVYLRRIQDFAVVAVAVGFATLFLMAVGARLIGETIEFDWDNAFHFLFSMILLTLWCAAITTGTVKLLAGIRRRMRHPDD